jgi:hypothetical protein
VGPRAGLDTEARGKFLCPCRGSNPDRPVVQPVVRHYIKNIVAIIIELFATQRPIASCLSGTKVYVVRENSEYDCSRAIFYKSTVFCKSNC